MSPGDPWLYVMTRSLGMNVGMKTAMDDDDNDDDDNNNKLLLTSFTDRENEVSKIFVMCLR